MTPLPQGGEGRVRGRRKRLQAERYTLTSAPLLREERESK